MTATAPHSEAEITVILRAAGCVFAEDEAALLVAQAPTPLVLDQLVDRRVAGEPLEVILGWAEFFGLRIEIDAGVFVPRRRTEFLVATAHELAAPGATVVDLCCGSGALGLALTSTLAAAHLVAADIEPAAVACARRNLAGIGEVVEGDLFDPLPTYLRDRVDLLLVNAPYVPSAEVERMPPEARLYEPRIALDGGEDGLDIHRRVAAEANDWLAPGGTLLIETSQAQAEDAVAIFTRNGLDTRIAYSEDYDATVVLGTRPEDAVS